MAALAIGVLIPLRTLAVPGGVSVQGRLLNNGIAVESASVVVTLKVTSQGASECTLFEETQSLNMTASDGVMALTLGQGTRTSNDKGLSVAQVFSNKPTTQSGLNCTSGGSSYTPSNADSRNVYITFNDNGTVVALSSPFAIQSVPYALEADSLSGKASTDFLQVTTDTTQSRINALTVPTTYNELIALAGGTSTQYATTSGGSFSGDVNLNSHKLTNLTSPSASTDAANKNYVDTTLGTKALDSTTIAALNNSTDSGKVLSWNGTTWTASVPASDATKLPLSGGTMSGAIAMGLNNILNAGYLTQGANKYLQFGNLTDAQETTLVATPLTSAYAGATWFNVTSNQLKYWDGSVVKTMSSSFPAQTANLVFAGPASGGSAVPSFRSVVEADVPNLTASGKVANSATTAASSNTANAIVARDSSGNFAATNATLTKTVLNDTQSTPNTVSLQAPSTVTTSYVLKMPAALTGTSGFVLSSDTSGNLSWIAPSTGSVTSVGATAPVASTGGSTPTISMAKATGSVDGYLAATDFTTFNGKQSSTLTNAHILVGNASNVATDVAVSGDISVTNAGAVTVATVGTSAASNIHLAELLANAATSASTNSTLVKRDSSGNFSSATATLTAANVGSVIYRDTGSNTVTVGAPTTVTTSYALKWPAAVGSLNQSLITDASGQLSWASPVVGGLSPLTSANIWVGNASNVATAVSPSGDVTVTNAGAFTVGSIGGSTAANVHAAELLANAATSANTVSTLLKRDGSGNFSATNATLSKAVLNDTQSTPNTVSLQAPSIVTTSYVLKMPTALPGTSGYILATDTSGNLSWIAPSTGSVTSVGATAPVASTGGSTPTISIAKATGSVDGYLAATDFTTFNAKLNAALTGAHLFVGNASNVATDVAASGDVAVTNAGSFTVNGVKGKSVSATPTTAGQVLRYDGTSWTPNYVSMTDLRSTVTGASSATTCTAGQTLTYTSVADNLSCTTIALSDSQITYASQAANKFFASPNGSSGAPTYRSITTADLPVTGTGGAFVNGGNAFGAASSLGSTDANNLNLMTNNANRMSINSAGNVGIGTTAPAYKLDVAGDVNVTGAFRVNGTTIGGGSGTVTSVSSANSDIAVANGTTTPALTLNSGTGAGQIVKLTAASKYPAVDGSLITNINLAAGVGTTVLPVANGGTNSSTALNNNRLMASVSGAITELAAMTDGQLVVGKTGSAPQLVSMSGDTTVSNTGAVTVGKINGTAVSGVGLANNNVLQNNSGSTLSGNNVLVSNAAGSGVTALTTPTSGVLTASGTVPSWSSTLATSLGGTGLTGFTTGDLLYASSTTALSKLAATTSGYVLTSAGVGTAPSWQPAQATGGALSAITAATATNTIDSLNFAQNWNWSTATTQSPLALSANALTTGSLLSLSSSSTSLNSTSGLLNVANTGSSTSGLVARIQSNSNAQSGVTVLASGNVGIGTTSPASKLHVASSPAASANYGTISAGGGAFDGSTSGFYGTGSSSSSNGTSIAVNELSGYAGDLMNLEVAGSSKFKVLNDGELRVNLPYGSVSVNNYGGITSSDVMFAAKMQDTNGTWALGNQVGATGIALNKNLIVGWASTTSFYDAKDTSLSRTGPGVLAVGNGTAGDYSGTLIAGSVGIGTTAPSAVLQLKGGTATASSAPLKFTAGTNLSTAENGAVEYDGTSLYFTTGGTRYPVALGGTANSSSSQTVGTGSASAPSINFSGDATTGLYQGGAGVIGFSSAGTSLGTWGSGGLTVAASTGSSSSTNGALIVSGGVGVGGNINAAGAITGNQVTSTGSSTAVYSPTSSTLNVPTGIMVKAGNSGSTNGEIAETYYATANSSGIGQRAYIGAISTAGASSFTPTIVIGQQVTDGNSYAERMRIDTSGNVGIGLTTPVYPLQVSGTGMFGGTSFNKIGLGIASGLTNGTGYLGYNAVRGASNWGVATDGTNNGGAISWADSTGNYNIATIPNSGTPTAAQSVTDAQMLTNTKMTISGAGNVGIGTTAPAYKLDVAGDINVTGAFRVNGAAINSGTVTSVSSVNTDIAVATGTTTPALTLNSGTGANQIVKLTSASKYPAVDGSLITNISLTAGVGTSVLPIANGGTNSSTTLNNNRLMASVSGSIAELAAMTDGQIVVGKTSSAPQLVTMSGDTSISNTGSVTVNKVNGTSVTGVGLANGNLLQNTSGSAIGGSNVLVSNAAGTGVTALASPTTGVLTSSGTVPTWSSSLGATLGGTGQTSFAVGDLLYASSTSALSKLAAANINYVLTSNGAGTAPSWQAAQATGGPLSSITAAGATNSIDSLTYAQTWNWSTATSQSPLALSAAALTSGSILSVSTASASLNSTNGLLYVANTGSSTSGMVARIQSSSAAQSGVTVLASGNVGIGTTAPAVKLEVAGTMVIDPSTVTNAATTLDLSASNTFTIATASGSAYTLSNMVNGGVYTVAITDATSRTYTFGCTGVTKYKPVNTATTASTTSIYSILTLKNGANYDCYVTWASGYQ